jgi:type IV pilus assembly protein PilX
MNTSPLVPCRATRGRAGGFALITALLLLVMLTLLALSMFHSFGLQQKITGNTREKERALQGAQTALQFGEWWISQSNLLSGDGGVACTSANTVAGPADMRLCSNALAKPGSPATWTAASSYTPSTMTVVANGGTVLMADGKTLDINYAEAPKLYVSYIGMNANGSAVLYSVTAAGYGGGADTSAVVQSVYSVPVDGTSLTGP